MVEKFDDKDAKNGNLKTKWNFERSLKALSMSLLSNSLKKVSVIGAGGKMGAGITLLILTLMAQKNNGSLQAIDTSEEALAGLKQYLRQQLTRYAEKSINALRKIYESKASLISNEEIIETFVWETLERIDYSSSIEAARDSSLIFEAAVENIDTKVRIFKKIKEMNSNAWILTNTSSIPVSLLNERADLNNRIAGFHFYNPPAVQKLVEIIELKNSPQEFKDYIKELGHSLNKLLVYSNDVPGFIGNGYFMREILYTFRIWDKTDFHLQQIESATKDFLLRPMGIFQLMDYVGLDVIKNILSIMKETLPDSSFETKDVDQWLLLGIRGGQSFDGQQKDGIFRYKAGKPEDLFSLSKKEYVPLSKDLHLGKPPLDLSWKNLSKAPNNELLKNYLVTLANEKTPGAEIANGYLEEGKRITNTLVDTHVAHSIEDVVTVLKYGFYHLYGAGDYEKF